MNALRSKLSLCMHTQVMLLATPTSESVQLCTTHAASVSSLCSCTLYPTAMSICVDHGNLRAFHEFRFAMHAHETSDTNSVLHFSLNICHLQINICLAFTAGFRHHKCVINAGLWTNAGQWEGCGEYTHSYTCLNKCIYHYLRPRHWMLSTPTINTSLFEMPVSC